MRAKCVVRVGFTLVILTDNGEVRKIVVGWIAINMVDFGLSVGVTANTAHAVPTQT